MHWNTSSNHFYGKDRRSCLILVVVSCSVFNFSLSVSTRDNSSRSEFIPYEVATLKCSFFSYSFNDIFDTIISFKNRNITCSMIF